MDLSGRVAIVTGAGRGLGAAYARSLAAVGASVVVNDLGCGLSGDLTDERPGDEVVRTIEAAGGSAIADFSDVASPGGAQALVANALQRFGRIDSVVTNAGIMRDGSFGKLAVADLEAVVRVHLFGTMYSVHAAWDALRESGSGRVVVISSSVGLYGGFGQANYAAAKLGVVGFMHALKIEGKRYGICANAVAPVGRSRMSTPLLDADVVSGLDPDFISPVVTYLCAPECVDSGLVLEVGAGLIARVQVVEADGVWVSTTPFTPDTIAERFDQIRDPAGARAYESSDDALARVFGAARAGASA